MTYREVIRDTVQVNPKHREKLWGEWVDSLADGRAVTSTTSCNTGAASVKKNAGSIRTGAASGTDGVDGLISTNYLLIYPYLYVIIVQVVSISECNLIASAILLPFLLFFAVKNAGCFPVIL